jgi:hypothetical protein
MIAMVLPHSLLQTTVRMTLAGCHSPSNKPNHQLDGKLIVSLASSRQSMLALDILPSLAILPTPQPHPLRQHSSKQDQGAWTRDGCRLGELEVVRHSVDCKVLHGSLLYLLLEAAL